MGETEHKNGLLPPTGGATSRNAISPIEDVIAAIGRGEIVVLVDDEDRENEGDLVIAAEYADAAAINFMARQGCGLICMTITAERARQFDLPPMTRDNTDPNQTAFTISVDAREGTTTGISAGDRARTVDVLLDESAKPDDMVTPGHLFPLVAREGGVLKRNGHTEASVDLAKLAGLKSAGIICEIMNEDGTMARLPDLLPYAEKHGLLIGTIADLVAYRLEREIPHALTGEVFIPTRKEG